MRVSEAFPSNYLKAADLQGKQVGVTIARCEMEDLGDDRKPVVYFEGKEKGLVLNKTNANNISLGYGDDMDDWRGCRIILFSAWVDYQGRSVEAIRVRPDKNAAPKKAAAPQPAPEPERMINDDEIPF